MSYGLPTGTNIAYGAPGFPQWVYDLGKAFSLQASTYPGHQEGDRAEAGYAPNPQGLNRGIDWAGTVPDMQRFADYLLSVRGYLEQVIWENPRTGRRVGVAGGDDVTTTPYYAGDYAGHRDHVHTRQSKPIPLPGSVTKEKNVGWSGDPVWLADVLKAYDGPKLKVAELPDWKDYGHGDFGDIWGIVVHHTGNAAADPWSIRNGRPDLDGPLSQLHIAPDGTVTVVAAGVAWHAGNGSWLGLPTNGANFHTIGIECAWPRDTSITAATQTRERWPDAQIIAMRDTCAAILGKLGYGVDRIIGHKEWAGRAQGKWDPGNLSMDWFRGEVAKAMRGDFKSVRPITAPAPVDRTAQLWLEWSAFLGDQTAVAAIVAAAKTDPRAALVLGAVERTNPAALRDFISRKG